MAALAAPARAEGWKKLDGQKVPDFQAKEWFNTGDQAPTAADLRGKVWLLEFFATW
jgi:hypothetical protein